MSRRTGGPTKFHFQKLTNSVSASSRRVNLTIDFPAVPNLRISGAIPPHSLAAYTETAQPLTLNTNLCNPDLGQIKIEVVLVSIKIKMSKAVLCDMTPCGLVVPC
jgi:hypothetical protein